jgi:hypothetical protein
MVENQTNSPVRHSIIGKDEKKMEGLDALSDGWCRWAAAEYER